MKDNWIDNTNFEHHEKRLVSNMIKMHDLVAKYVNYNFPNNISEFSNEEEIKLNIMNSFLVNIRYLNRKYNK